VLDVLWAGSVELDVLLRQVSEEMAGRIHTATIVVAAYRSVSI